METLTDKCPYCDKEVTYYWNRGIISSPNYVLVADWVMHSDCYDKEVNEYFEKNPRLS